MRSTHFDTPWSICLFILWHISWQAWKPSRKRLTTPFKVSDAGSKLGKDQLPIDESCADAAPRQRPNAFGKTLPWPSLGPCRTAISPLSSYRKHAYAVGVCVCVMGKVISQAKPKLAKQLRMDVNSQILLMLHFKLPRPALRLKFNS